MEPGQAHPHTDDRSGYGRRGVLLGGLAAMVAGVLGRPRDVDAASGEPVIAGERNTAESPTQLIAGGSGPGLAVRQTSVPDDDKLAFAGAGVAGVGERFGMLGTTLAPSELSLSDLAPEVRVGVSGFSSGVGVLGSTFIDESNTCCGFTGTFMRPGVAGFGNSFGMLGSTLAPSELSLSDLAPERGAGVTGFGQGVGVWGVRGGAPAAPRLGPAGVLGSASGGDTAVAAENEAGFAFRSLGRLAFSTAGEGTIERGRMVGVVENAAIHKDSLANVTLLNSPGGPGRLVYADPQDGALAVHLSHPAREQTRFAYFVFHGLE